MMNGNDDGGTREHLRRDLQARRHQLMDDVQRRLERIRQVDPRAASAAEVVEDDTSEIDVGLIEIMNATVHRIDAALERIADGVYGQCARCHGPISEARLRAMPFAVCCHRCESSSERHSTMLRAQPRKSSWEEGLMFARGEES
jgi:RNA polymerase-binding transcription factor DksA